MISVRGALADDITRFKSSFKVRDIVYSGLGIYSLVEPPPPMGPSGILSGLPPMCSTSALIIAASIEDDFLSK